MRFRTAFRIGIVAALGMMIALSLGLQAQTPDTTSGTDLATGWLNTGSEAQPLALARIETKRGDPIGNWLRERAERKVSKSPRTDEGKIPASSRDVLEQSTRLEQAQAAITWWRSLCILLAALLGGAILWVAVGR
jgi:hypothetical protein